MRKLIRALAISGLAASAGPLSFEAYGQGYIDVEAERAASAAKSSSSNPNTYSAPAPTSTPAPATPAPDPYGSSPAQAYPATSYGTNSGSAPTQSLPSAAAPVGGGVGGAENLGNLFYQLQLLQQEVMTLNGKVEEQAHELRKLREQNLERYVDVDRRLGELSGGGSASAGAGGGSATSRSPVVAAPAGAGGNSSASEMPGEGDAYRAAYALVREQKFDQAIADFKKFLQNYPAGKYAPNAHYWLGELYLVVQPADLESSRQAFMLLLDQYPDNSKVPDALYKVGKVQFMKGNRDRAKEFFDRVINDYGSTNSSAVNLARQFLEENY